MELSVIIVLIEEVIWNIDRTASAHQMSSIKT